MISYARYGQKSEPFHSAKSWYFFVDTHLSYSFFWRHFIVFVGFLSYTTQ